MNRCPNQGSSSAAERSDPQLLLALVRMVVSPVVEPPAKRERPRDDRLVESAEPELLGGRVRHLLRRRDPRGGHEDEKRNSLRRSRCQRRDPTTLAVAPESYELSVDRVQHCQGISHLHGEAAPRRIARRLAVAAAIEGHDADPRRGQDAMQVLVEHSVARPLTRAVQRHDRRLAGRRVARRERDPLVLDA